MAPPDGEAVIIAQFTVLFPVYHLFIANPVDAPRPLRAGAAVSADELDRIGTLQGTSDVPAVANAIDDF